MDIEAWLKDLGLAEYCEAFRANRIDAELLAQLTSDDLRELGVTALGDRKRLLTAIAALNAQELRARPQRKAIEEEEEGQWRQVTILFADITGFTSLSEQLDAERAHEILNRYFDIADGIVQRFGGFVDKHIGDNVMAVFGAPVAHDNDPERAVLAALALHSEARKIARPDGQPLQLHIGIASGKVVASGTGSELHREYTVTGESVNLAARLQDLSGPGQTLISDTVQKQTAGRIVARRLEPQRLKGIERPVVVWQVERALGPDHAQRATAFIGRRAESRQCRAILREVAEFGLGRAIVLRGSAGIGKTRLANEIERLAEADGFQVHRCFVLDFGTSKEQEALPALVKSLLGLPAVCSEDEKAAAAESAVESGIVDDVERVFLNDALDVPQDPKAKRIYDAMDDATRRIGRHRLAASLVLAAARKAPQLIVVEDLHWANGPTLELLSGILAETRESPVAFIATTRPEGDPLDRAWRSISSDLSIGVINLGPLRPEEAREMAASFDAQDAGRVAECVKRAAGNPLFLEQLLQNAAEVAAAAVPDSIQSLVLARMDRLATPDRTAAQAASVLGQRFDLAALKHLVDSPSYDCADLVRHQLVRPEGEDYLFTHALVRDGIYESILSGARSRLHLKASEWFQERDKTLEAEHLYMAGDRRAVRAYLEAAKIELSKHRSEQGLALLRKGLPLASESTEKFEIALALGQAEHDVGDLTAAAAAFAEALDTAKDDAELCQAWIGMAAVKRITDDLEGALADVSKAEEVAQKHGLAAEEARAHHLRGNLLFPRGEIDGCLSEHAAALEIARHEGLAEIEAAALGGLGDGEYMLGRMRSAFERFNSCVEISRDRGLGRIEVANLPMAAITGVWCGTLDGARAMAQDAIASALRIGYSRAEMIAHHAAFLCERSNLDQTAARRHAKAAFDIARRLGAKRFEAEALLFEAELDFISGNRARAHELSRAALDMSRNFGMSYMGPAILGGLALVTDDTGERQAASAEAEEMLAAGAISHNHFLFRLYAIDAELRVGEHCEAERHARALLAYCPEPGLELVEFRANRGLALARAAQGERSDQLADEVEALIAQGERIGEPVMLIELRKAAALLETKRKAEPGAG